MSNEQEKIENVDSKPKNTICILDAPMNGKVYLVGTAHFSLESQKEVSELIKRVQPNRVVLELCPSRVNILNLDEATILRESKEMNTNKILKLIREVKKMQKNHFYFNSVLI
jgi:pheromone shutdown protein TraB